VAIEQATAFAPSNIALCKYWGKRCSKLNLPINSSLSISLGNRGTTTTVSIIDGITDRIVLDNKLLDLQDSFCVKIIKFLNLFRDQLPNNTAFQIDTTSNIPTAAGLASSASGFAALVKSLDKLFGWGYSPLKLSKLARLGSGSASRSIYNGFVKWHCGELTDGSDSFSERLNIEWPEFCVGLLIFDQAKKYLGSTQGMLQSVATSPLYSGWRQLASNDLNAIEEAISVKDFGLLGQTAEHNALAMHAVMLSSRPSIMYANSDTINNIQKIWQLRQDTGVALYFTQDAGPNLKLLFLRQDLATVKQYFPQTEIVLPFAAIKIQESYYE
jgi:diphosphomevalonate decarboxylase